MQARVITGIILYFAAIALPTAWLFVEYGPSAPVDASSAGDLGILACTTAVAFVVGLVASKVSQPRGASLHDTLQEVLQGIRQSRSDAGSNPMEARR